MYLSGITPAQQQQLVSQLYSLQAQYATAVQALNVCKANSPNMDFCNDSNVTMAVETLAQQIAYVQSQLAQPVDYGAPSAPVTSPAVGVPTPVGPALQTGIPPSAGTPLVPMAAGSPFSPTDIDVQSVTGNTQALVPGSAAPAGETQPAPSRGLLWALLAAGAVIIGS